MNPKPKTPIPLLTFAFAAVAMICLIALAPAPVLAGGPCSNAAAFLVAPPGSTTIINNGVPVQFQQQFQVQQFQQYGVPVQQFQSFSASPQVFVQPVVVQQQRLQFQHQQRLQFQRQPLLQLNLNAGPHRRAFAVTPLGIAVRRGNNVAALTPFGLFVRRN